MKIAIIGSGGREHALAMACAKSLVCTSVVVIPGNPGMLNHDKISISAESIENYVITKPVNLVIIGPEDMLASGLSDRLRAKSINVFGPSQAAAMLESSKIFSKLMMRESGVVTADFKSANNEQEAQKAIEELIDDSGIVLKADGLASGKGVIVCDNKKQAFEAANTLLQKFGSPLLIEKKVRGKEVSAMYLCLEEEVVCLGFACDHKRLLDADRGPNTGGMGTFSPVKWIDQSMSNRIESEVIRPILKNMKLRGTPFCGMLFAGLMIDQETINVLEFNVRFGDPETQALLPRLEWDAASMLDAVARSDKESFKQQKIIEKNMACVHVVKASLGYPEKPILGKTIRLQTLPQNVDLYFAGVKKQDDSLVTNGGRVLGLSALAATFSEARELAYDSLHVADFDDAIFRRDIGVSHD